MLFVSFLDVMQDINRLLNRCRLHDDLLETALQGSVLLNGVTVFIQCGGTDALYCTSCQGRLEDIGGIHASWCGASTDKRVDLIDKHNDIGIGLDLLDQGADTLLKLSTVFRTCHDGSHIEVHHTFVEQHR